MSFGFQCFFSYLFYPVHLFRLAFSQCVASVDGSFLCHRPYAAAGFVYAEYVVAPSGDSQTERFVGMAVNHIANAIVTYNIISPRCSLVVVHYFHLGNVG